MSWSDIDPSGELSRLFAGMEAERNGSARWKMVGRSLNGQSMTIVVSANEKTRWLRAITGWTPPTAEECKIPDEGVRTWSRRTK